MIETEAAGWSHTATTAITVVGGIITALVTHWLTKRKTDPALATIEPSRHIDNITDPPTREALLALEHELELRRQVLHAYLNAQRIACWESDKHGACVFASDRLAEYVGLDKADILGDGWVTNLHDDDKERVYRAWKAAVKQKRGFIMTYTFVHADGVEVKVTANSQPILRDRMNPDGTLSREMRGMIGVLTPVNNE
jgi:PAS domain S-box-containing protein